MKRVLSLFLALFLLCPLLTAQGAVRGKISLEGKILNPKKGESFEVTVKLDQNPGIVSLRTTLSFDPKVLRLDEVTGAGAMPGFSFDPMENSVLLRWKRNGQGPDLTYTGDLAKIRFCVVDEPVYGDSAIDLAVSQNLYDAQNNDGYSVPFDAVGLAFTLICPHEKTDRSVQKEPDFETAGEMIQTCKSCGETERIPILPTLQSEDGSVRATLAVGEYKNNEKKGLSTELLSEGEEWKTASDTFGDSLVSVFRLAFTRDDAPFYPAGETKIELTQKDLPDEVALYILLDGGAERIDFARENDTLSFDYHDLPYVLVAREDPETPAIPETTPPSTTTASTTTENTEDAQQQKEITLIVIGALVLILCGTGGIVLLNKRKKF